MYTNIDKQLGAETIAYWVSKDLTRSPNAEIH